MGYLDNFLVFKVYYDCKILLDYDESQALFDRCLKADWPIGFEFNGTENYASDIVELRCTHLPTEPELKQISETIEAIKGALLKAPDNKHTFIKGGL